MPERTTARCSVPSVALQALAAWLGATAGSAQEPARPSLLATVPDAALAVVEVGDAGSMLDALDRALLPLPAELPASVHAQVAAAVLAVRAFAQQPPGELLRTLAGGGAVLGLVPAGRRPLPLLVLRPGDPAAAVAFLQRFPERVRCERRGDLVLASPTADGLRLLQAHAGAPSGRWTERAACLAPAAGELRAILDLAALRTLVPALQDPPLERSNGGVRFLLAPLLAALATATEITAALRAGDAGIDIDLCLDGTVLGTLFGELMPGGGAPRTIPRAPAGALGVLALDRSVRRLLSEPARFLDERGVLAVRAFLSVADQIDGSVTSFVPDIVGSFGEPVTAYLVPTDATELDQPPPLLFPGLAIAAPVARASAERDLSRTAAAIGLIVNQERSRQRRTPFRLRAVREADVTGVVAEPAPWQGPGAPPIEQGLSPALLFGHGHVVLATTSIAAHAVLAQIATGARAPVAGDELTLYGPAIAAAIEQSQGPIALARRLDEGDTAQQADGFLAALTAVLRMVAVAHLSLHSGDAATSLHLALHRRS